jgi:AraC-like DNA-binding protein
LVRDGDTQLARSPALLLSYAEHRGQDRGELMRAASLSEQDLADPDTRIPVVAMHRLWRAVLEKDPDPIIGLKVGRAVTVRRLGLIGYVMYFSETLLDALLHLSRYSRLLSDASQFRVMKTQDGVSLIINTRPYMIALRQPINASLASLITVARRITQADLVPLSVHLPIPPPGSLEPYRTVFGDVVHFDCPVAEIRFTEKQMALPARANDSVLSGYLDELAEGKLKALSELDSEFIDRVRRGIWANLQNSKPSLYRAARNIGMSPRTLQRRLGEHGTSFSIVLDELRRGLSDELRKNRGFAVSEVAFLLGYSESSAYLRAVRRWRRSPGDEQLAS